MSQTQARVRTLEGLVDGSVRGVVEVTPRGQIHWATPRASGWLQTYWPDATREPSKLPQPLADWLRLQDSRWDARSEVTSPAIPLRREGHAGTLIVRFVREQDRRLLYFEERVEGPCPDMLGPLGLGQRERETLVWVARGKTNDAIATILGISPKTVKKHLERIYQKLGVESRTAAAARVFDCVGRGAASPER